MERAFAVDFSRIRVCEVGQAIELNAAAYTIGDAIFFAPGMYRPWSRRGQELLGHELAHVVQQRLSRAVATSTMMGLPICDDLELEREADRLGELAARGRPCRVTAVGSTSGSECAVIQRREWNVAPDGGMSKGDWLQQDREKNTQRWRNANLYNLEHQRNQEYTNPTERAAFYLWFYNHVSKKGFEVRWPLAAYIVASGAAQISESGIPPNDVQAATRQGNQVIFDDVFPKLDELRRGSVLRGIQAHQWDAQTLSEEQNLVQSMYADVSGEVLARFESYAKKGGSAWIGIMLGLADDSVKGGTWHYQGVVPAFKGDIRNVEDRYKYGMRLADQYSTHLPGNGAGFSLPRAVGAGYRDGSTYKSLNKYRGLHRLDAELDDLYVDDEDEARIIRILQKLNIGEQQQLGANEDRLLLLLDHLDSAQRAQALLGLEAVSKEVRATLMR